MVTKILNTIILNRTGMFGSILIPPVLAFLVIFIIDIIRFYSSGSKLILIEYYQLFNIYITAAFAYSFIYSLIAASGRITASLLARISSLWHNTGQGIIVFLFIVEPLVFSGLIKAGADIWNPDYLIFFIYFIIILTATLVVLFLIRSFPGHLLAFIITALLVTRSVLHPAFGSDDPEFLILIHLVYGLLSWILYLLLVNHQRIRLLFGYDRFTVSFSVFVFQTFLIIGLTAVLVNHSFNEKETELVFINKKISSLYFNIFLILFYILNLHLYFSNVMVFMLNLPEYRKLFSLSAAFIAAVLLVMILPGIRYFIADQPDRSLSVLFESRISGPLAMRFLKETDKDNDNNSSWPGRDPDDSDPCVHYSIKFLGFSEQHNRCEALPLNNTLESGPDSAKEFTVITVKDIYNKYEPIAQLSGILLLAGDETPHALNGIMRFSDIRYFYSTATDTAFFSLLAKNGYRTLCFFYPEGDYLNINLTGRPFSLRPGINGDYLLDQGCQIFYNFRGEISKDSEYFIRQHGYEDFILDKIRKHRKDKTAVWIHTDSLKHIDLHRLTEQRKKNGPVILLFLNKNSPTAFVYTITDAGNAGSEHRRILLTLEPVIKELLQIRIQSDFLKDNSFTGFAGKADPDKLYPENIFSYKNGLIEMRNSMTGFVRSYKTDDIRTGQIPQFF